MQAGKFMLVPIWGGIALPQANQLGSLEWLEQSCDEIADELLQGPGELFVGDGPGDSELAERCSNAPLLINELAAYPQQLLDPLQGYGQQHVLYDELAENQLSTSNPELLVLSGKIRGAIRRAEMRAAVSLLAGAWQPLRKILLEQERQGWMNGRWHRAQLQVSLLETVIDPAIAFLSAATHTSVMTTPVGLLKRSNTEFVYRPEEDEMDCHDLLRASALHLQLRKTAVVIEKFFRTTEKSERPDQTQGGRRVRNLGPIRAGREGQG